MHNITNRIVTLCTRHPLVVYALILTLTLLAGIQIPKIQIDTDPENMLDSGHPARVFHNQTKNAFSMYDAIVVGAVNEQTPDGIYTPASLAKLHQLTDAILNIDGVVDADVMSLSTVDNLTQAGPGTLRFEWMMATPPESPEQAREVRQHVERLPLLFDTLVSQDSQAAAIYVPILDKNESYRIAEEIRAQISLFSGEEHWYITGLPVAEDQFGYEMFVQMGISAPLAGLAIFVLLWVFFRSFALIMAPMMVAMSTVIVTMGLLIGSGFTVHIMSSMIAIFLMPIAVVDSVHILSEFSDRYKPGENAKEVIKEVVGHLFTPMLFTSITSSVGFFSLMLTPIPPVQVFGGFVGFGILFAFVVTIVLIPAYLSRLSDSSLDKLQASLHHHDSHNGLLARGVRAIGHLATHYRGSIVITSAVVMAVSVWGIMQIQINDNPVRWFKPSHEIRVADKVLNEHFAGTYDAYLVLSDTRELLSVGQLLPSQSLPESLVEWRSASSDYVLEQPAEERLQALAVALEDKLFDDLNQAESSYLETALRNTEDALSTSKAFLSPGNLAYIEALQIDLQQSGLVGKSNSLADVVKLVNRELKSGQHEDYQLPASAQGVAQALLQYQSSHRPGDLWHMVTPDYRQSLIWLQLKEGDNQDMTAVVDRVQNYVSSHPLPGGMELNWAGKAYLNLVWQDNMVAGMLNSLVSAFVIVFIMMMLLFRSLVFGLLAMLPLTLTISAIYGLIGLIGKDYDMPIAVLSSLTLGLSVDFAIHFLERARASWRESGSIEQTFRELFAEPATAISRNALVIALGFTPLLFAPLVPYITVGVFLASIMIISALVTLVVLPAVMWLTRRWAFTS
ncbi:RND transporter [Alteromonas aestuariivivens]|uniref:RND transporter n=1 Tax=Alteromonas aestuariivivens TaxID=1938339 RepID=A0A3D8MAR5_9ALTE|nr:MMPL family transporter [Alteromonas aestuariivivens]RDV26788.1 RND transporter [Alteromonas aestuariivivens]